MEINDGSTCDLKIIYREIPCGIVISENQFGKCLRATKQFAKGDLLYHGCMLLLDENEIDEEYRLITRINGFENGCTYTLNKHTHFVCNL